MIHSKGHIKYLRALNKRKKSEILISECQGYITASENLRQAKAVTPSLSFEKNRINVTIIVATVNNGATTSSLVETLARQIEKSCKRVSHRANTSLAVGTILTVLLHAPSNFGVEQRKFISLSSLGRLRQQFWGRISWKRLQPRWNVKTNIHLAH